MIITHRKNNWKYILVAAFLAFIVSGGAFTKFIILKKTEKEAVVNPIKDIASSEFTKYFNPILKANPELKFVKEEPRQIVARETNFPRPPLNKEDPIWIFSPDGTKAISIFGYFGEPESRLDIYNRHNDGKVENLSICGTPCRYWVVFWLNNEQFVFIESFYDNLSQPNQSYYQLYISLYDFLKNEVISFRSQKLKEEPKSPGSEWPTEWQKRLEFLKK